MEFLAYLLLGIHIIVSLWAHNFYTFLIYEPPQIKRKRLLKLWFIPVFGLLPILQYRKIMIERSKNGPIAQLKKSMEQDKSTNEQQ